MNPKQEKLAGLYRRALKRHLKRVGVVAPASMKGFATAACAEGLLPIELLRLHERILVTSVLPGLVGRPRSAVMKRAADFLASVMGSGLRLDGEPSPEGMAAHRFLHMLIGRSAENAASKHELGLEVAELKVAQAGLRKSELQHGRLFAKSDQFQKQLRRLSRQLLTAQEDERRRISLELHDVVAQTLTAINIRLAVVKKQAVMNSKGIARNIASTQRLVEKSVNIVQRFARELRPVVLDDLGLIPALHSFLKSFGAQTGIRTHLTAFAGIESLETVQRTTFFRVAQEALTNVARHARASRVDLVLSESDGSTRMLLKDDGRGFNIERLGKIVSSRHLGVIGMRERLEMIGGCFVLESTPGKGTTIVASIPTQRKDPARRDGRLKPV